MAVLILGKTRCALCDQVLNDLDDIVNFPPIFFNQRHAVWEVNDAAVHRLCLLERPYASAALAKLADFERHASMPKICKVCGRPITSPGDYFATGPLADEPDEPVSEVSWFQAHLSCLATWDGNDHLIDLLDVVARSPDWEGDVLFWLVDRVIATRRSKPG